MMNRLSLQVLKQVSVEVVDRLSAGMPVITNDPSELLSGIRMHFLNEVWRLVNSSNRRVTLDTVEGLPCFAGLGVDFQVVDVLEPRIPHITIGIDRKLMGLGYHLLILACRILREIDGKGLVAVPWSLVFISGDRTGDYQTTFALREILRRKGNRDDMLAVMEERFPTMDEVERDNWVARILESPPRLGYLTHSNSEKPSIRLARALELASGSKAGHADGLEELYSIRSPWSAFRADIGRT